MNAIRNHIRQYLDRNRTNMAALERAAGCAEGNLCKIMKGVQTMSPLVFERLAPVVHWTDECVEECRANYERIRKLRNGSRKDGREEGWQPWTLTVAKAKSGAFLYATGRWG